jgi:hypothetical protein
MDRDAFTAANLPSAPERRIVSYFDHEFIPLTENKINHDVAEIADAGFSHVVMTISETDMASLDRQARIHDAVTRFNSVGIEVWADPWHLGGVHGGEAVSHFEQSGEKSCICNPKLDTLVRDWLQIVGQTGIKKVFWDEPEMKCQEHKDDELMYVESYTNAASELGLANAVCLTANSKKKWQLDELATYKSVEEIATDPYYPNAFRIIPEDERLSYVTEWASHTRSVAEANGKLSHIWVQAFAIPHGAEHIVQEHIDMCRQSMVDIALWGYAACASVPDFIKPGQASPDRVWNMAKNAIRPRA